MAKLEKRKILVSNRSMEETDMEYPEIRKEILATLKKYKVSLIQTRGVFDWILEDIESMSLENLL